MSPSTPEAPSRQTRQSLRTKAAVRIALWSAFAIFTTGGAFFVVVKSALEEQLEKRGRALAKSIGRTSELALLSGRAKEAAEAVDPFFRGDDEIVYVIVVDKDEKPVLSRVRRGHRELAPAELIRIHRVIGAGPIDVQKHLRTSHGLVGFTAPVQALRRGVAPELIYEEDAPPLRGEPLSSTGAQPDGGTPPGDGGIPADGTNPADSTNRSNDAIRAIGVPPANGKNTAKNAKNGKSPESLARPTTPERTTGAAGPPPVGADGGAGNEEDDDLLPELKLAPLPSPARTRERDERERSTDSAGHEPEEVGRVLLGLSQEPLVNRLWTLMKAGLVIASSAILILLLALFYSSRGVFRRVEQMVALAYHISRGDLTHRVEVTTEDELGRLGDALNRISTNLGSMLGRVHEVTGHLGRAVDTLSLTSQEVVGGARVQSEAVVKTQVAVLAMNENLRTIASDVEVLGQAARQSSLAIQEMTGLNQEVLSQVVSMGRSVDATTGSIEDMAQSVREVAASVEAQSTEAARTSRSMADMDQAIREVQKASADSAALSERVRHDAEHGALAVERLLRGIRGIDRQGSAVMKAMGRLDEKVRSVGVILNLIDEIAEQVNLLSLNAAIIAAQAGEHGTAFAVVADEIKELSDRTSTSTRQISGLVQAIEAESKNAAHEVAQAARHTQSGMKLTSLAEEALAKIVDSASQGAAMAKIIARATVGQAHGSEVVTDSAQRIADAVSRIAEAAAQQARTSDLIARSAVQMREITQNVDTSCNAEAQAAEDVSKGLDRIAKMVESLQTAQRTEARSAEDVRQAMDNIRRVADGHRESMATLERAIQTLSAQAKTLSTEVERFTL